MGYQQDSVLINRLEYDFGAIPPNVSDISTRFQITNISSEPIFILSAFESCRCLDIHWSKSAILPGQYGYIDVKYVLTEDISPFKKSIGVRLSNSDQVIYLTI